MVAVVQPRGPCLLVNATLENMMGLSRRTLMRGSVFDWLVDPTPLRETLRRWPATRSPRPLRRRDAAAPLGGAHGAKLPVHVIVSQMDHGGMCWWR
jgi:two-component system nitrogen regulation sensor histidine kinase GlnL